MYCDGACSGNPGPGAWAALLMTGDKSRELSGFDPATTNNRMELMAAIGGLEALKRRCRVKIHADSRYVIDGITQWMPNWVRRGWKTASGGPVINRDLWERLSAAVAKHDVQWIWVRGHSGVKYNEHVDQLAQQTLQKALCAN